MDLVLEFFCLNLLEEFWKAFDPGLVLLGFSHRRSVAREMSSFKSGTEECSILEWIYKCEGPCLCKKLQ